MTERDDHPDPPTPTHLDAHGHARMVDISAKPQTRRVARARAVVEMTPELREALMTGSLPKGEGLGVARLAGIQAAKETARLIPLCHPIPLTSVSVDFRPLGADRVEVTAEVSCTAATGVEMEAMTAVSVACLALYDMCKGLDRGVRIGSIELVHKSGGKSGTWQREPES